MLKITEAPALIHAGLYHLELDGRQVGTVNVFSGCLDAIRAALEETPEAAYLLEEQGREIATLVKRLANAEMLIERLKREVKELDFSVALHDRAAKKARAIWEEEHPDAEFMPGRTDLMVGLMERVEKAEAVKESLTTALREIEEIAEDRNLIAFKQICDIAKKQQEDSANTDGDWDILNDIETNLRAKTDGMKRLLESQTLSPELAALGRELVRLAEKSLGEVTE